MTAYVSVAPAALRAAVAAHCLASGSNRREAALVSENLVLANLSGHDSHGVGMTPQYLAAVREKRLNVNQSAKLAVDAGALITVDGGMGYGQVIGHEAIEMAIQRARQFGVCVLSLRNSHHVGRIGHWGEQCASAGLVSTHYVNVINRPPLVAPFGGSDARFATNPYCAAFPSPDGKPLVLDMATSTIAMGKVRMAMNKGEQVAPDTLIDHQGNPTRDPKVMWTDPKGAILAFGAHKGYSLAVVAELLSGALSGGGTVRDGKWQRNTITNNMLSILIDPGKLGGAESWQNEMTDFLRWVKASPPAPGVEQVLVAGEPERRTRAERAAGIPIDLTSWNEILAAGESVGVAANETRRIANLS